MPRPGRGPISVGRPAASFLALLSLSWLIPAGIVAAGLLRRLDLSLALSLLVALYDSLQAAGILLLAKEHGGKGDSINQGVAVSSVEVVLILDADTELLPGALAALEHRFAPGAGP